MNNQPNPLLMEVGRYLVGEGHLEAGGLVAFASFSQADVDAWVESLPDPLAPLFFGLRVEDTGTLMPFNSRMVVARLAPYQAALVGLPAPMMEVYNILKAVDEKFTAFLPD